MSSAIPLAPNGEKKASRVFIDGCFDLSHFSNATILRQAKQYGKKLIVGVHNDDEIEDQIHLPVFMEEDRYRLIGAIKWVDEVFEDSPYVTNVSTLNQLDCDFCLIKIGCDPTASGKEKHDEIRDTPRARTFTPLQYVTENEVCGRILLMKKSHHLNPENILHFQNRIQEFSSDSTGQTSWTKVSLYDSTSDVYTELSCGRIPRATDKIVYVCGAFDLFNGGHLSFLEEAKEYGDYLIVGIFDDATVNKDRETNQPINNLLERSLAICSLKLVDEVIIAAPNIVDAELLDRFKINIVADGSVKRHITRFQEPIARKIIVEVDSGSEQTTSELIDRIISQRVEHPSMSTSDIITFNPVTSNNNNQH